MVFNETKNIGDIISASDWNDFVDFTEAISGVAYWASGEIKPLSGAFWSHSGNTKIHFPSSNLGSLAYKDLVDISDDTNLGVTSPITLTDDIIGINLATSTVSGALKASDWSRFDEKQDAYSHGILSNGIGIQSFSVGISGANKTVAVEFGTGDTQVASGSHLHDNRYYTETESDTKFYPSSEGHDHVTDSSIHFTKESLDDDYAPSGTLDWASISSLSDVNIASPSAGHTLTYMGATDKWKNVYPPMTFSIANVKISAQQNINLARFNLPGASKCYVWCASACGSGGVSIADLKIQILSGTSIIYGTSSSTVQQGSPLAETAGNIEIRLAYSGANANGSVFGTGFMNISII